MEEMEKLAIDIKMISDNLENYLEYPNKTKSKNLRLELGELKKKITDYRRILMELDKEGY